MEIRSEDKKLIVISLYTNNQIQLTENAGKYNTYIENYLIRYLSTNYHKQQENEFGIVITNTDIKLALMMVNPKYIDAKNKQDKYIENFDIGGSNLNLPSENYKQRRVQEDLSIFFKTSERLLNRIISDSIKNMEKKSLLTANKTFRLFEVLENGYLKGHDVCTKEEHEKVLHARYSAMQEFNENFPQYKVKEMVDVIFLSPYHSDQFWKIMKLCLIDEFDGKYEFFSNAYSLIISEQAINNELRKLNYKNMNNNVKNKLLSAKDMQILNDNLKHQFVDFFVDI